MAVSTKSGGSGLGLDQGLQRQAHQFRDHLAGGAAAKQLRQFCGGRIGDGHGLVARRCYCSDQSHSPAHLIPPQGPEQRVVSTGYAGAELRELHHLEGCPRCHWRRSPSSSPLSLSTIRKGGLLRLAGESPWRRGIKCAQGAAGIQGGHGGALHHHGVVLREGLFEGW